MSQRFLRNEPNSIKPLFFRDLGAHEHTADVKLVPSTLYPHKQEFPMFWRHPRQEKEGQFTRKNSLNDYATLQNKPNFE